MRNKPKRDWWLAGAFIGLPIAIMLTVRIVASTVAYSDYEEDRIGMVRDQIERRGINSPRILDALRSVPRHAFVPEEMAPYAYADKPLPIGEGQTISQPYIVAFMTEALQPEAHERILEIGTGSGYQSAILAELCQAVYSIEVNPHLGQQARERLEALEYENVLVRIGDGFNGWPEFAPFDAIIVTCAPSEIPQPLIEQIAEGGRMVIPVGDGYAQTLHIFEKIEGALQASGELSVRFVPMRDLKGDVY